MQNAAEVPPCDGYDRMLIKPKLPGLCEAQRRFLDAYRECLTVAQAARLSGVHRATAYRWLGDAAFAAAMQAAAEVYFREHRAKVVAEEAARQQWREARERERRPMRCHFLALARAAKRR